MTGSRPARVMVTGAQGFLGRDIVARCLALGTHVEVLGVGRSAERRGAYTHALRVAGGARPAPLPARLRQALATRRYRYERIDITDRVGLARLVDRFRPSVVVHAAATLRDGDADLMRQVNVGGTDNVLQAAGAVGAAVVVVSSGSLAATGDRRSLGQEMPGRPAGSARRQPGAVHGYVDSKRAAEEAARSAHGDGIHAVVARVFNLIGPGAHTAHLPGRIAMELAWHRAQLDDGVRSTGSAGTGIDPGIVVRTGDLSARRDLVDCRDAARMVVALAVATPAAVRHACGVPVGHLPVVDVGTGVATEMAELVRMQVVVAGLGGRVQVVESAARARGSDVLVADTTAVDRLGASPRTHVPTVVAAMADYAADQVC